MRRWQPRESPSATRVRRSRTLPPPIQFPSHLHPAWRGTTPALWPGGQVEHPSDEIVLQESRQIIPVCVVPAAVCRDKAALARVTNALSAVVDELIHRLDRDAIDL